MQAIQIHHSSCLGMDISIRPASTQQSWPSTFAREGTWRTSGASAWGPLEGGKWENRCRSRFSFQPSYRGHLTPPAAPKGMEGDGASE
eukprot:3934788-Rhodomonas_salina.1